tara:strand:- start:6650 stop:6904 length:255 start_codon:yes stop_codon:yes gene_type:complete
MNLFGIGLTELVFVVVISFIVLGPTKSIDVLKNLVKTLRHLRNAWEDVKSTVDEAVDEAKLDFKYMDKLLDTDATNAREKQSDD